MHCPFCNANNRDHARFCGTCGRPLSRPHDVRPGATTAVETPPLPHARPPSRGRPVRAIRMVATGLAAWLTSLVLLGLVVGFIGTRWVDRSSTRCPTPNVRFDGVMRRSTMSPRERVVIRSRTIMLQSPTRLILP